MSDLDLYADLITRKLVSSDGGAVTISPFVLGDQLRCSLRTYERNESGDIRERDLRVRTLRASIGRVLAAPTTGWFKLWIGGTETPEIAFEANADVFKTATQGAGIIETVESPVTGAWVVKTTRPDSEGPYAISVHTNKLGPISFVRVRQFKQLGCWWFECRLIQAPLAFDSGHERVLPTPPTVRRIHAGSAGSETEPPVNELQALHVPPDFRGTYFLRWNYRVSKLLGRDIEIPDLTDLFPSARLPANFDPKGAGEGKTDNLPRPPGLLPAIHDASVVPITVPLPPPEPNVGNVFQNTTSAPLLVPGGLGRRGGYLEPQGYAGSDGRVWYRLSRAADTNSFFPSDFERELFLLHINDAMWTPGGNFTVEFDLELRLVLSNTRAQMLLVIEVGSAPAQATPAPVAENLENIAWQPAPLLSQRIILTGLKLKHHFGAAIKRSLDNVITAERRLYITWLAAPVAPASPSFVIRARLLQFDTENSVRNGKGYVFASMTGAKAQLI